MGSMIPWDRESRSMGSDLGSIFGIHEHVWMTASKYLGEVSLFHVQSCNADSLSHAGEQFSLRAQSLSDDSHLVYIPSLVEKLSSK